MTDEVQAQLRKTHMMLNVLAETFDLDGDGVKISLSVVKKTSGDETPIMSFTLAEILRENEALLARIDQEKSNGST